MIDWTVAKFAEHPDGRLARHSSWSNDLWDAEGIDELVNSAELSVHGFVPVVESGNTVLRSKYVEACKKAWGYGPRDSDEAFLKYCGFEVVEDPLPTNTEKLESILKGLGTFHAWESEVLAVALDKNGVVAGE